MDFLRCLWCLEGLLLGVVVGRKGLSGYNVLPEGDCAALQVGC